MKFDQQAKLDILLGLFISTLVAANLLGSKITTIAGVAVSVGIFAYPFSFLITDIVAEVFGKEKTKKFILSGFISLIAVILLTALAIILPPAGRYQFNEEYRIIFSASLRITIASLIAFTLAQYHDVWAFHFWKKKTGGRWLWLRNNLSTIVSQFIDTTIFMFVAFYLITPKFTAEFIFALIIPYWIFKIVFALLDMPLVYAGVKWLKIGRASCRERV